MMSTVLLVISIVVFVCWCYCSSGVLGKYLTENNKGWFTIFTYAVALIVFNVVVWNIYCNYVIGVNS